MSRNKKVVESTSEQSVMAFLSLKLPKQHPAQHLDEDPGMGLTRSDVAFTTRGRRDGEEGQHGQDSENE